MKSPIDKQRNPKDTSTVSKKQFIAEYAAAVRVIWPHMGFTEINAGDEIDGVVAGRMGPSTLLKDIAKLHGAQRGRVGNFLRGLQ